MDPYEILGIRLSAGGEEIELAYRGRRSQYHPDRYTSSDAETLNWATSKMQEVNQAYAALRIRSVVREWMKKCELSLGAQQARQTPPARLSRDSRMP